MNTTEIAAKLSEYATVTDGDYMSIRNGSKVADLHVQDGAVHASIWIDYGNDGRSFCDAKDYKTTQGAVRFVRTFLR